MNSTGRGASCLFKMNHGGPASPFSALSIFDHTDEQYGTETGCAAGYKGFASQASTDSARHLAGRDLGKGIGKGGADVDKGVAKTVRSRSEVPPRK